MYAIHAPSGDQVGSPPQPAMTFGSLPSTFATVSLLLSLKASRCPSGDHAARSAPATVSETVQVRCTNL